MAKKTKVIPEPVYPDTSFRVQLDSKTIITCHSKEGFKKWKARYPNAKKI